MEINSIDPTENNKNEILKAHQLTGHSCPNITYLFLKQHKTEVPKFKEVEEVIKRCECCLKTIVKKHLKFFQLLEVHHLQ